MNFKAVPERNIKKAEKALRGVYYNATHQVYADRLSSIPGLEQYHLIENRHTNIKGWARRDCLHISANNLCTNLQEALSPFVDSLIKRSMAQELLATFLNVENWNHLKALEKRSSNNAASCYVLQEIENISAFDSRVTLLSCFQGLPAALCGFGEALREQDSKTFQIDTDYVIQVHATNFTRTTDEERALSGNYNRESKGLSLDIMQVIESDKDYMTVAAKLLCSKEFDKDMLTLFKYNQSLEQQILAMNACQGIQREDHIFIKDWVFWVDRHCGHYGTFYGERLSALGKLEFKRIASEWHKAGISYIDEDNQYWLYSDWDRKPEYPLVGLTETDVTHVERRLIKEENWSDWQFADIMSDENRKS